ncbi:MAG: thioredoxin family protein [Planctomycetota bacterium]
MIAWLEDRDAAAAAAAQDDRPILLWASGPGKGSQRMADVTWADPRLQEFVAKSVVPCRFDITTAPELCEQHGIVWRPTVLICDAQWRAGHRVVGYLPPSEMLAQIPLGIGKLRFRQGRWAEAEKHFEGTAQGYPGTEAAPEAQYWLGASRFQREHKPNGLVAAWNDLMERWPASRWATRASVIKES